MGYLFWSFSMVKRTDLLSGLTLSSWGKSHLVMVCIFCVARLKLLKFCQEFLCLSS